jgi:tRNA(Ile)-lysidine synthase
MNMDLVQRVRDTINENGLFSPGDKVVGGVSGGPDSLALLHLLRRLREELQINLHVAHLNHRLRGPESDADAEFVARLAHEWNLPATIESRDVRALARERHLGLEEAAREARYAFLAEVAAGVGAGVIAVAHQADDQVESVLMHLIRGAGLAGLAGMGLQVKIRNSKFEIGNSKAEEEQPSSGEAGFRTSDFQFRISNFDFPISNPELRIVRPLLDVTRAEIEAYCHEQGLTARVDASNLDTTLFRNRLRHEVIPYLERLNPGLRRVLLHTARALADDYAIVRREVRKALAKVAREEEGVVVFARQAWRELPPALRRGTLRAAVEQLRGDLRDVDWVHIENAHRIVLEKGVGTAATLPHGLLLVVGYDEFVVGDATRVRAWVPRADWPLLNREPLELPVQGVVALPDSEWLVETELTHDREVPADRWTARLDFDRCSGERVLRCRRPGDRFQPSGLEGHTRLVAKFLIDAKVPRAVRDRLPLLAADERVLWVCGLRVDERARVRPETRQVWQVRFRKSTSR